MKTIKKALCILLTIVSFISMMTPAMANEDIEVKIDGELIEFDVPPQIIDGRTMVPLRTIFETLGATVEWNAEDRSIDSYKGGRSVYLQIDNYNMLVDGNQVKLDVPAKVIDGRTLVPIRAISEALDVDVRWEDSTKTVFLSTKCKFVAPEENYSKKMMENYYYYAVNNALDDMIKFAYETTITSYYITQNDLRFYLADLSGDGHNELIITDRHEGQYIVYAFIDNEVKKIYETVNGCMGTGAWLTEYNGEFYMVNESFSSATGFRISLLQFDSLTGEAVEKHHVCMQFEYIEDGVPAEVYEKFRQMVVDNKRLFSPIHELKDKIMK